MALTSRLAMGLMGVGQTSESPAPGACPSAKQLAGIVDPTDPCQATNQALVPGACPSAKQLQGIADPTDPCQAANIAAGLPATSTSVPGQLLGVSTNTWIIGGAVVLALFLMMGARR